MRIGMGYHAHKTEQGTKQMKNTVFAAAADALLGAAAFGDIGDFTSEEADRSGKAVLRSAAEKLEENLYVISNLDILIIAEDQSIREEFPEIRDAIAGVLHLERDQINLKLSDASVFAGLGKEGYVIARAAASIETIANYSYEVGAGSGCAGCGGCPMR